MLRHWTLNALAKGGRGGRNIDGWSKSEEASCTGVICLMHSNQPMPNQILARRERCYDRGGPVSDLIGPDWSGCDPQIHSI